MRCSTCIQATSKQLPVSEVCKHCHNYSHHIPAGIVLPLNCYNVTLHLHQCQDGERFVSTERFMRMARVIAETDITVRLGD